MAIDSQDLRVAEVRKNDYRFVSERAIGAAGTYEVESITLLALRTDRRSLRGPEFVGIAQVVGRVPGWRRPRPTARYPPRTNRGARGKAG